MRTPSHRRSQRRSACQLPEGRDLRDLISSVRYVGSTEHKSYPSDAGQPALRSDATPCDHRIGTFEDFEDWLRQGMAEGKIGAPWEGSPGYPRYVWFEMTGVCDEARLVNRVLGEYKGYALTDSEHRDLYLQRGWK